MKIPSQQVLLALSLLASPAQSYPGKHPRCSAGDACWPKEHVWQDFNSTISGRLIRTFPAAAVCHTAQYDAAACSVAKERWTDSFWRTNQTGAYSAILWELGDKGQCFINTPKEEKCDQGIVPYYSVSASGVKDIEKAVKFADKHDLYLVVKNTGHDHLGRSSGSGAFSIWTHNLKGKEWHKSFKPKGAPSNVGGIPAVTLQAGEQLLVIDVYKAAAAEGVTFAGGSAQTVGAAGGFMTGGGVSPFSHFYGLAVDNVLEVNLVTAQGKAKTINQYTDPDYFYALRGGGGSAWGVITSVTYKTHPKPTHIRVGIAQLNVTTEDARRVVIEKSLQALPDITEAGWVGYGVYATEKTNPTAFQVIFLQPNATIENFNKTFEPMNKIGTLPGVTGGAVSYVFPDFLEYSKNFLCDPNIATNVIDASRLVSRQVLTERASDLVDLMFEYPTTGPGFNSIVKVNSDERDNTSVHSSFKDSRALISFSVDWADNASEQEKKRAKKTSAEVSKRLAEIVGKETGTYLNEASPYEPDWQNAFWGDKYARLLSIKRRIDPKNLFVCNRCVGTDIVLEP
ncbi:FAD-binding PCMH-type domain-containing protein [Trichophyton interdigitale]|uniref:FAD-binding PCMH-type domain-containing protein n=1 Tax=Trichophyton interdigitale TaxID=101480 RepID=A0A9P5CXG3_9EURO|nr:FAD-binding PCMH-type domain-containing protein [Trichophyton interdigitale]KAF3895246.1 FAD-binding PCMH-type domain-containing protein [Trichophyton interdigitale]KAG8208713.1 FAD-binding PCMH-type domain-containing protein [Trichophyton interdigitale]